jgi:uncharacterized protein
MSEKPLAGKKVAVLVETEYIYDEIEYYKKRVPELGGEVHLLSYLWGQASKDFVNDIDSPDRPVTDVHRLTVDRCVTHSDPNDYDIVICLANYVAVRLREIPPMGSLGSPELTRTAPAVRFFAKAMQNRRIVKGAMCHALWLLTPHPELLRGRRVICHTVVLSDIHNAGAIFVPDPSHVVIDGDLVTARSFHDVEAYFNAIVQVASSPVESRQPVCPPVAPPAADAHEDLHHALLAAVEANDLAKAGELLRCRGANPNRRGPSPYTALMIAAGRGYVQMTELLLNAGADVNVMDSSLGATPLHKAVQSGSVEVARLLLDHGAFLNAQSAVVGHTPLIDAIWSKNVAMVTFLLERGATLNIPGHHGAAAKDFVGDTCLWTAGFTVPEKEWWGRQIRKELEARQRKNDEAVAQQPLMQAVQTGDLEAVRRLIVEGADVNERSPVVGGGNDGQTPLLAACFLGYTEIVQELLKAGANPRTVDYLFKSTPGHKAAYAGRPEALRAVVASGQLQVDAQGPYNGYTALHDSIWHGHIDAAKVLLEAGVRTDLRGHDGHTPYELAVKLGYNEIAELIPKPAPKPA